MPYLAPREEQKVPIEMATVASPVTKSFTRENDDLRSSRQPASTKQPVSPLASSVVKSPESIPPHASKYRQGWGIDAMDEFQGKPHTPPKSSQQQPATNEAFNGGNTSGLSASSSERTPRSGPWLFRCPPDCGKCSRDDLQISESAAEPCPQIEENQNTSSKRSSSSSLCTLHSTSTSATSLSCSLATLKASTGQPRSQAYLSHLMDTDHSNPHIIAESSKRLERHARENPGKHNLGFMACAMLHATRRGREEWENAIAVMEDDEQDSDGDRVGMMADELWKQHKKRGLVLEGTMVERKWRTREEGWARMESKREGAGR